MTQNHMTYTVGTVPRAVASGAGANRRSLPFAVLTRRLNPVPGAPNI